MTPDQIATKADIAALADQMERLVDMIARINPPPERVSLEAAAKICGVRVQTVREWIRDGKLEAQGGKRHRSVARSDLEEMKKEQSEKEADTRSVSTSVRRAVFKRDGKACRYCGVTKGPFHLDHIHPWSRGGPSVLENLVVSCGSCNLSKRDRTYQEWRGTDEAFHP